MGSFRPKHGWPSLTRNAVGNQAVDGPEIQQDEIQRWRPTPPLAASWIVSQQHLRAHNAKRQERGIALREALRAVDEAHPGLDARNVLARVDLAALGRREPPTLRTIQLHLKRIRAVAQIRNEQQGRRLR